VRFRIDNVLYEPIKPLPKALQASIVSRIKIMGRLNIAEKRLPQDGRIRLKIAGRDYDVRLSTLPVAYGERVVMRLLPRTQELLDLTTLGFDEQQLATMNKLITRPNGIVLVTGPTGSGKTTTLYGALSRINATDKNIITIEDPVEIQLAGVGQIEVNAKVGLTFANGLRSILRQDPNVILVGEIRDLETAEIAIQAALTGHLVFSTLHTNDAPSALTRLVDLGVKPFLVSASVQAVLAQRLVRRLCPECSAEYDPTPLELAAIGLDAQLAAGRRFRRPRGCRACEGSGYRGRIALYESLTMEPVIRDMTFRGESLEAVRETATSTGALRALVNDGARKVLEGVTSVAEVLRVSRSKGELPA
jgi:general secretion pathway protein E